jgi:uncharacterized membrane protein
MGENNFAAGPVAAYGVDLLGSSIAYYILVRALLAVHSNDSVLARAIGSDFKGKISTVLYIAALPLAYVNALISCGLYIAVAVMWIIPDRRIEKALMP